MNKKILFLLPLMTMLLIGCANTIDNKGKDEESGQQSSQTSDSSGESSSSEPSSVTPITSGYGLVVGNQSIALTDTTADHPDMAAPQVGLYEADLTNLKANDEAYFTLDGEKITQIGASGDDTSGGRYNIFFGMGNNTGDFIIEADCASTHVYLNKYQDGGYAVFAEGGVAGDPDHGGGEEMGSKYKILINGTAYETIHNDSALDPSFDEYYALNIACNVGDVMQAYDAENKASWTIPNLDSASQGWAMQNNQIVCTESGSYDFYLKFKYQNDQVYIGHHS